MISIGDSVRLLKHPSQPDGTVISISFMDDMVEVKWNNPSLIPRTQEYPRSMFHDGSFFVFPKSSTGWCVCECGSKYDKEAPNTHSFWCPAFQKEKK